MTKIGHIERGDRWAAIHRQLLVATGLVIALCFGIGGWTATTELAGAVIAPGTVVVDSGVKQVQHPTGGVIADLKVREGEYVEAGQVLLLLDATQARANLEIISLNLDELSARMARLQAERDGKVLLEFDSDLLARRWDNDVSQLISGEQRLFNARRESREGQRAQLRERILQLEHEIAGLTSNLEAKERERQLVEKVWKGLEELRRQHLVTMTRVTEVERSAAQIDGDRGELRAALARARAKIAETELQIMQLDQDQQAEVGRELADVRREIAELRERRVSAEDQLARVELRSPQDGFVHQLQVHTVGGVARAGETLMLIVPSAERLTIEAQVRPEDIDRLASGQVAMVRLKAADQQTTPELKGGVSVISADVVVDAQTGTRSYNVRIEVDDHELSQLGDLRLIPGMPVEAFIATGERTVLSYLLKPLSDQIARAFRER